METSKMREKCIYISYTEMSDSVQEFTDDVRMTQDLAVDGNITANGFFVDAARKRIIQTNPVIVANNITVGSGAYSFRTTKVKNGVTTTTSAVEICATEAATVSATLNATNAITAR